MLKKASPPFPLIGSGVTAFDAHVFGDAFGDYATTTIMAMQIIGIWTAFESLVGDLWEAAVNDHPNLGFIALDAVISPSDDEEESEKKHRATLPVALRMLNKTPGIDLSRHLGTIIREHGKWDFSKREQAKDAYRKTFPSLWSDLSPVLKDQNLFWLTKLRNAIIHRGGKADSDFITSFKRHPTLCKVADKELIPIDGEIVAALGNSVIRIARILLQKIDNELQKLQMQC